MDLHKDVAAVLRRHRVGMIDECDQIATAVMVPVSAHVDTMAAVVERQRRRIQELEAALERQRDSIAARIVEEEQRCQEAITADPTNPHLAGRLAGLQRARDITRTLYAR